MISTTQTLADRMASGRIPVGEALRMAAQIADQLRYLQDQGTAHGELTPWTVGVSGISAQLLPPVGSGVTPYTAPEVAEGRPADTRSDIYAFGAVFYEMMTGRAAFDGSAVAPRPSGSPALDRLVSACLAKAPEARYQRVQKLILELKMLASAARRMGPAAPAPEPVMMIPAIAPVADAPAAAAPIQPPPTPAPVPTPLVVATPVVEAAAPAVHYQMQELENRIGARLAEQERAIASVAQVANEVLMALRQQQAAAAPPPQQFHAYAPPPPPQRQYTRSYTPEHYDDYSSMRLEKGVDAIGDRLARVDLVVGTMVERLQKLEEQFEAFDTDCAALRDSVTRDIRNFERALKTQSTAIESARTAMGQTDDLVERVVEALDSLQSMFVNGDERSLAS